MPDRLAILLTAVIVGCMACASSPNGPQPLRDTSTRITEGGLKFFIYRWNWHTEEAFGTVDAAGIARADGSHFQPGSYYHRETEFVEEAEAWLQETGYCREGYFELSRYYDVAGARLRGECKDLANEQDRARFGGPDQSSETSLNTSSAG